MNITCLSKGKGFYCPPCHIIDVCGFRVLLNCPIDLSALSIFSPVGDLNGEVGCEDCDDMEINVNVEDVKNVPRKRRKVEKIVEGADLIRGVPWYKFVGNLTLWNIASVDVVLISNPMAMLGLPFVTRMEGFCAKIYATEATVKLGEFMIRDILSMHMEFRQIYGPESEFPEWLRWENLEKRPSTISDIAAGEGGVELNSWMPLYSAAQVKDCVKMIHSLKYAEETCYNGTINITAFSSGLEIGACNWRLNGPEINLVCLSASIFTSTHASSFDFQALTKSDMVFCSDSDLSSMHCDRDDETQDASVESLLTTNESQEEVEKLELICSCMVESLRSGGSVLIPFGRLGLILLLLEQINSYLDSSGLKIPIYFISSIAEELLAFTNIIPEWVCKDRQEKLFSCEPLFGHADLVKQKKLCLFPAVHSHDLLKTWQEPCIVIAPHWSLRLGPAVHLLQRWRGDQHSLLVLEERTDADTYLIPFMPMEMKILQCSFLSGMKLSKIKPLLDALKTKHVLLPEELHDIFPPTMEALPYSVTRYSENETVVVPYKKNNSVLEISMDVASQLKWKKTKQAETSVAQLMGNLSLQQGKHRLLNPSDSSDTPPSQPLIFWGSPDPRTLQSHLKDVGLSSFIETKETSKIFDAHISEPGKALVQVRETSTVISAATEHLASLIYNAIASSLDSI